MGLVYEIPMWIDVHTHLQMLEESPEDALKEAEQNQVHRLITIGTEPKDLQEVLDLGKKFFPRVACTLGVHPHEANLFSSETENFIRSQAHLPAVVAVGEIGLDFHYDHSSREEQFHAFRRQMDLAGELGLPVQIHSREAERETLDVLREFSGRVSGLLHCFTSSLEMAKSALDLGFDISISGVVTFHNAHELRQTVRALPLDRIHLETDAPFLAPVPHRGKKNKPAFVVEVARKVAEIKGVDLTDLSKQIMTNASQIFKKLEVHQ